jgi:hypothetical protein
MSRPIKTIYYGHRKQVLQINTSNDANRAVAQCVAHMQTNHYKATSAQVHDDTDGVLHADVHRSVKGTITIHYSRDPEAYHNRYALAAVLPEIKATRRRK